MTHRLCTALVATILLVAAAPSSAQSGAAQPPEQNDPAKDSKDVDTTVAYPAAAVLAAAKLALDTFGCSVKKERPDYLECTRDRRIGVVLGSGGEKVTVQLSEAGGETRVQIKTGKGFVGRLGKKNWSTPIFDEMVKTLKES